MRTEPIVELLVEIPGLPIQVGRFKRVGIFDLVLTQPMHWKIETYGHSGALYIGPTDWSWRYPGTLNMSNWWPGCTVTLKPEDVTIHVDTSVWPAEVATPTTG